MQIKELQARQGNVNLIGTVTEIGDTREFEKFGKTGRVANAKLKDESGEVTLTLWNDDIDKVKAGDKIEIENGWVSEWQGELQLGTGKFGKLNVMDKDEGEHILTDDERTESDALDGCQDDEGEYVLDKDEKTEEYDLEELNKPDAGDDVLTEDEKEEADKNSPNSPKEKEGVQVVEMVPEDKKESNEDVQVVDVGSEQREEKPKESKELEVVDTEPTEEPKKEETQEEIAIVVEEDEPKDEPVADGVDLTGKKVLVVDTSSNPKRDKEAGDMLDEAADKQEDYSEEDEVEINDVEEEEIK